MALNNFPGVWHKEIEIVKFEKIVGDNFPG